MVQLLWPKKDYTYFIGTREKTMDFLWVPIFMSQGRGLLFDFKGGASPPFPCVIASKLTFCASDVASQKPQNTLQKISDPFRTKPFAIKSADSQEALIRLSH